MVSALDSTVKAVKYNTECYCAVVLSVVLIRRRYKRQGGYIVYDLLKCYGSNRKLGNHTLLLYCHLFSVLFGSSVVKRPC